MDESQGLEELGAQVGPITQPDKLASASVSRVFSETVQDQTLKRLEDEDIRLTPAELRDQVSANVDPQSNLVVVKGKSETPAAAQAIATLTAEVTARVTNRIARHDFRNKADAFRKQISDKEGGNDGPGSLSRSFLNDQLSRLDALGQFASPADVTQFATLPISPTAPRPPRDIVLALFLGTLLAVGAALARETLDRRVHSSDEIHELLDLPVVGYVRERIMGDPPFGRNGGGRMDERDADAFRIMRANLGFLDIDSPPRSLLVTSALPEEGKSTVAAAIAQASALAGTRTLLLECDLRRPVMAKRLGIEAEPGLTDHLSRMIEFQDIVQAIQSPENGSTAVEAMGTAQLVCVTAGSRSPQPAEMLGSQRFSELLTWLTEAYDLVVIDSAPLLSVVDARELVPLVDAVFLCTRVSRTTRGQMTAAKSALERFPKRATAVVVTGMRPRDEPDYGYYSYAY